jgi:hypothetical protein
MNFSEYTLVSFGDSFTFGQDIVPARDLDRDIKDFPNQTRINWKKECNEKAYTQVIANRMGFKNSLNFGVPGSSNERSIMLLHSFLHENPTLKIFVLFNFTASCRFLQYLKIEGERAYTPTNFYPSTWISNNQVSSGKFTGITKRSIENQYTYWRNSIQDVYNHIKDRRTLYYMLSSHNTPHVTFDIINNTDALMLRDNPIDYIQEDTFILETLYNDDEQYVFKELGFFESYYEELVDNSPLLSHIGIDSLGGLQNMSAYLNSKGKDEHNDEDYYRASHVGRHWNIDGHVEAAKLIEKFINEKYDN